MMIAKPATKYQGIAPINLPDRQWPSRTIARAPIWLSTDLRDGNQALFEPMNGERKMKLFEELVRIGFKEIEVGFPAASQTDFDFVRRLIDENLIPDDVTIMVMTQSREDLIARTVEAVKGAPRAIVHLYNATAPAWRRIVFGMNVTQVMQLIAHHVGYLKQLTDAQPETQWTLQYSPETFSATELSVSRSRPARPRLPHGTRAPAVPSSSTCPPRWRTPRPTCLPTRSSGWTGTSVPREHITLSVHPHNDRGTGVAAAELAMMAGADRVEGCLFGNGERCGNVDIVTLALNLYTQGVHPHLDFSDITAVARVAEECTSLPVHPRHPYAGDLVFTAFSGSHQDAIKKGFAAQDPNALWEVPYLPIDPADLGRTYDSVIRVNSQSGKGGIAFLLEREHGVVMPRRMQVEFSAVVQRHTDTSETEMGAAQLWELFQATYLRAPAEPAVVCHSHRLDEDGQGIELDVSIEGVRQTLRGQGNGPIAATVDALGLPLRVDHYEERATGTGANAQALAIVEAAMDGVTGSTFGAGTSHNIVTASVQAIVSVANRLAQRRPQAQVAQSA